MTKDEFYMGKAIEEAKIAAAVGEIPVGAVVIYQKKAIARAYNLRETLPCATAHAELLAIEKACRQQPPRPRRLRLRRSKGRRRPFTVSNRRQSGPEPPRRSDGRRPGRRMRCYHARFLPQPAAKINKTQLSDIIMT